MKEASIAIVGAGLAGLTAARVFHEAGLDPLVLEASPRIGGRIESLQGEDGSYLGDLGPNWVWPPFQPVVQHWLDRLSLPVFDQYERGDAILDGFAPQPMQQPLPGQYGIARLVGGQAQFIQAMAKPLPDTAIQTDQPVTQVTARSDGRLAVHVDHAPAICAQRVVMAAPLRVIHERIALPDHLDPTLDQALRTTPTWMAAQAKAVIRYREPFWRGRGLSGRIASRTGPLFEVHDHTTSGGAPALFGFVATPYEAREPEALRRAIVAQLQRCFGQSAAHPLSVTLRDWATDPWICARADLTGPMEHPRVAPDVLRQGHLDDRLWFCAAETATQSPGLIEGALAAGEATARAVLKLDPRARIHHEAS